MSVGSGCKLQDVPGQRRLSYTIANTYGRKPSLQFLARKVSAAKDEHAEMEENVELVYVPPRLAVVVLRDADKRYNIGENVLHGLNMTVEHGTIYTVFGESGSGKTTLLAIIAGARSLTRGKCLVYGKPPGSRECIVPGNAVGYMPQDICIYPNFTISEILTYYGILYGKSWDEVKEALAEISSLLQLPNKNRLVGTLSGGQQRRTSLALALIHKPDLLILDEPTVGLDPLLVRKVWDHLVHLVETRQTTVIVSTVTLAEAKKSNTIGIIRNGCIIAERSPDALMAEFGTTELDEAILKLCKRDDMNYLVNGPLTLKGTGNSGSMDDVESYLQGAFVDDNMSLLTVTKPDGRFLDGSKERVRALLLKNTTAWRRSFYFLFVILTPAILCYVCGNTSRYRCRNLPFGVVELEGKSVSTYESQFILPEDCDSRYLSCGFLSSIDPDGFKLKFFPTEDAAVKEVKNGNIYGFILFPTNFSENMYQRISSGLSVSELVMNNSNIKIRMDQSSKLLRSEILAYFNDALRLFYTAILRDGSGYNPDFVSSTLKFEIAVYGENMPIVFELAVGAIPSVISFSPIIGTAIQLIGEKRRGTLERSLVAGVKPWEMMIAQSIVDLAVLGLQALVLYFIVLRLIFEIEPQGNQLLALLLCCTIGLAGVSMGIFRTHALADFYAGYLVGTIFSEEIQAAIVAFTFLIPSMTVTGGFWPLEGLPEGVKTAVCFLPITFSIKSLKGIIAKGWGFSHPQVWPGFVVPFGYTILFLTLTTILHNRKIVKS